AVRELHPRAARRSAPQRALRGPAGPRPQLHRDGQEGRSDPQGQRRPQRRRDHRLDHRRPRRQAPEGHAEGRPVLLRQRRQPPSPRPPPDRAPAQEGRRRQGRRGPQGWGGDSMTGSPIEALGRVAGGDAQAIIDTARQGAIPDQLDPDAIVSQIVPEGARWEVKDLEQYLERPRRAAGTVELQERAELVRYVERHDDVDSTTLWVDAEGLAVTAILNDHEGGAGSETRAPGNPAWGDHRAELKLKHTPEWEHWLRADKKLLSQADFAEHIDAGLKEIVTPEGATMLEIAQSIEGSVSAEFKSAKRLRDGNVQIEYV